MKIGNIVLPQLPKGARLRADNELARRERDTALSDVERLRQALRTLPFKGGL